MTNYRLMVICLFTILIVCAAPLYAQDNSENGQAIKRLEVVKKFDILSQLNGQTILVGQEFELTEAQQASLRDIFEKHYRRQDELLRDTEVDFVRAKLLTAMGKPEGEKIQARFDIRYTGIKQKVVSSAEDILLPNQVRRLKQIATQRRLTDQIEGADEFQIPVLIAKEMKLEPDEIAKIEKLVAKERLDYHTKLAKKRKDLNASLMKQLDKQTVTTIKNYFGEFYDTEQELLQELKKVKR